MKHITCLCPSGVGVLSGVYDDWEDLHRLYTLFATYSKMYQSLYPKMLFIWSLTEESHNCPVPCSIEGVHRVGCELRPDGKAVYLDRVCNREQFAPSNSRTFIEFVFLQLGDVPSAHSRVFIISYLSQINSCNPLTYPYFTKAKNPLT